MTLKLIIGNKNYSSWSLRAWLAIELTGAPYDEERIPLYQADSRSRLLSLSPTGKVPVLQCEDGTLWDSLAIAEYLAERFPEAHLWPLGQTARAHARSACAEMHSGFVPLRSHMPMDLRRQKPLDEVPEEVQADIRRICALWAGCRGRFGQDGPFLFGHASIADAFFAPVAARLRSYAVALPADAEAYVETIYRWPAFQRWYQAAMQETEIIE
jgi:glutathione S-transferase